MITVHHLENSRSQRPIWLLEELGADYEIRRYKRDPVTILAPPELREVHSLGKSPVISDGDGDGDVTVAESGAIIEYLLDRFDDGRLRPGGPAHLAYRYWLHYAEGSFMPLMLLSLILNRIETARMPFFAKPVAKGIAGKIRDGFLDANVSRHLDFIEKTLSEQDWFAGDAFSAADIQMSYCLEAASARMNLGTSYPAMQACLDRMRARDAYQRALQKGGPGTIPGFG